jgi:uncharacterized protein
MARISNYLLMLIWLIAASPLSAQKVYTLETIPDPKTGGRGYVSDPDDYLTPEEENRLNQMIAQLEDSATAQVAVVMVGSIGDENPKDFATRLFNYWGIGQADVDNGLLIFTVVDQRRTEFETGYGLEGVLPDVYCYRIGMQELVPYFKQEQYGQGLIAATARIKEILEDPEAAQEIRSGSSTRGRRWLFGIPPALQWYILINFLFFVGLITWIILTLNSKEDLYDKYTHIRYATTFIFIILFPLFYIPVYFYLKKLGEKLRNHPRFSKVNGKPMRKLSEEEDDRFLERGQITEEEIGSVDYDVWVTDDEDDVLILRYKSRFSKYSKCPECRFLTYFLAHSRVIRQATYSSSGQKENTYECKNCGYTHRKYITIPQKQHSSSSSGGSSGGGSWGGGRSGGGGSGVSW